MSFFFRGLCLIMAASPVICLAAGQSSLGRSSIVLPEEMSDARDWADHRAAAFDPHTKRQSPIRVHSVSQGWGTFEHGYSVNHLPLTLNGKTFQRGFGSHADAAFTVDLPSEATRFSSRCGIDDTAEARDAKHGVIFIVLADGREVFRSAEMTADKDPASIDLDVHGIKQLTFKATATGRFEYTPADWGEPQITLKSGETVRLGERLQLSNDDGSCFSFVYDGRSSTELIPNWKFESESLPAESDRIGHRFIATDPVSGLQSIIEIKQYLSYPVVEWTQRWINTGPAASGMLEKIQSMDIRLPADDQLLLHHNIGDHAAADSYQPIVTELARGASAQFAPDGGRPTNRAWPYFNIEEPLQHRGAIVVTAWPGEWSAEMSRDAEDGVLRITAGQQLTHLRLAPGEQISTPLSVVLFYRGDATRAQNLWRRWMLDCNVPHLDGELPPAIHASSLGLHQSEKTETDGIKLFDSQHANLTHWWMDAGWYPCKDAEGGWWPVGTWEPDATRFPHGIRPVSDLAHARGLKTILWFEPERAHVDSWLDQKHPEWLLHSEASPEERLLDLGNPGAWSWLCDFLDAKLTSEAIDIYRQDFNFDPLPFWRAHDAPDRQGITEMRHVEGYLKLWDELRRRHPHLLIDTCASGGRRLDLQTLRRSVSLWPCDDSTIPEDNQEHAFGVASWMPYFGSGVGCDTSYIIRSAMFPFWAFGLPTEGRTMDWDLYRRETAIWSSIRENMIGDYYPLTSYSLDPSTWLAWQYDRPDLGTGIVQAFRRPKSPFTAARFPLHGIDPKAAYSVTNMDKPDEIKQIQGQELIKSGVEVDLGELPAAGIVMYRKVLSP